MNRCISIYIYIYTFYEINLAKTQKRKVDLTKEYHKSIMMMIIVY